MDGTAPILVELDDNDCIEDVFITFHTYGWGDSGLGEDDPEDYWSYEECLAAAERFVENLLENSE